MSLFRSLKGFREVLGHSDRILNQVARTQSSHRTGFGAIAGLGAVGAVGVAAGLGSDNNEIAGLGAGLMTSAGVLGAAAFALTGREREFMRRGISLLDRESGNARRAVMGGVEHTDPVRRGAAQTRVNDVINHIGANPNMSEMQRREMAARAGFGTGHLRTLGNSTAGADRTIGTTATRRRDGLEITGYEDLSTADVHQDLMNRARGIISNGDPMTRVDRQEMAFARRSRIRGGHINGGNYNGLTAGEHTTAELNSYGYIDFDQTRAGVHSKLARSYRDKGLHQEADKLESTMLDAELGFGGGATLNNDGRAVVNNDLTAQLEQYQNRPGTLNRHEKREYKRLTARRDFIQNYGQPVNDATFEGAEAGRFEMPRDAGAGTPERTWYNRGGTDTSQRGMGTSVDRLLGRARGTGQAGAADFIPEATMNNGIRRHGFQESFPTGRVDDQGNLILDAHGNPEIGAPGSFNSRDNIMGGNPVGRFFRGAAAHGLADFGLLPTLGGAANAAYSGLTYGGDENGESTFGGRGEAMVEGFKSGFGKTFAAVGIGKGMQMGGRAALAASGNTRIFDAIGGFMGAPSFYESIERGAKATMGRGTHPAVGSIPDRINTQIRAQSVSANLGFLEEEGRFLGGAAEREAALTTRAADPSLTARQRQGATRDLAQHTQRAERSAYNLDRNFNAAGNEAERIIYGEMDEFGDYSGRGALSFSELPTIAATYAGAALGGGVRAGEVVKGFMNEQRGRMGSGYRRSNPQRLGLRPEDAETLGVPEMQGILRSTASYAGSIARPSALSIGVPAMGIGAIAGIAGMVGSAGGGGMGHPLNALMGNQDGAITANAQMQADASERVRMSNPTELKLSDIAENYYTNPSLKPTRGRHKPGRYNDDGGLVLALSNLRRS